MTIREWENLRRPDDKVCETPEEIAEDRARRTVLVRVGKDVSLTVGARLGHNCIIDDYTFISGDVEVGNGVRIGKNCYIKSAKIGDGAIVGDWVHTSGEGYTAVIPAERGVDKHSPLLNGRHELATSKCW